MTIEDFIHSLQTYTSPAVCNPWRDYDRTCDLGPQAPEIRRHQLQEYLAQRIGQARYLFVAEAAGYQGCRFTGIAITCERMLLGAHKQVTSAMVLGHTGQRTSRPDSPYITSRPQRDHGMNEPTDTYVWGAILDNGLNPRDVLLWNIFPFHPHKDSP
ncbi:MAG: uracil-DNA glycosylase, partial [Caecibacter massiliensis]|nr:uracil-DNA glycosylase [Caecibacter massiliensis]